jgi:hypothetical protein
VVDKSDQNVSKTVSQAANLAAMTIGDKTTANIGDKKVCSLLIYIQYNIYIYAYILKNYQSYLKNLYLMSNYVKLWFYIYVIVELYYRSHKKTFICATCRPVKEVKLYAADVF